MTYLPERVITKTDLDKLQNKWDATSIFAQDAQRVLNNGLDQAILAEYSNANSYISAQDLGSSGTDEVAITEANIANLFSVAARKLEHADVPTNDVVAVIGPRLLETLKLYVGGRETGFGDTVSANGKVGTRFGFDIVVSNNIPFYSLITYGSTTDNPTDGDTFTMDGIVFTFKDTLGTDPVVAGEIKIETNADDTMTNLIDCINFTDESTNDTTDYSKLSSTSKKRILKHGIEATSVSGTTFKIEGYGDIALIDSADNFAVTNNVQYPVFMKRGAIDLVIQKSPSVEFRMAQVRLGRFVYPWVVYGVYTFEQMKDAITYCKVDTSNWV